MFSVQFYILNFVQVLKDQSLSKFKNFLELIVIKCSLKYSKAYSVVM